MPSKRKLLHQAWWPDVILIVILGLLPFLFFWQLITPNAADRMNITSGDFTEQYFPLRAFSAQEWVRGQIPLWNPYLYGGQPALADIQSGALYPVHIAEALGFGWGGPLFGREFGFPLKALELQVIIHFSLAAVGTYLFARRAHRRYGVPLHRARFGGVIASLVFAYGGYLTGFPVQQLTILEVSAWLPWILWGLDAALQRTDESKASRITYALRIAPPLIWAALAFAMAILAGHPQTVLYIVYLTLGYTIFFAITNYQLPITNDHRFFWNLLLNLFGWLIVILLGTALAAAQLLPTMEFISRSVRADLSYQAVSAGLPLSELVTILYPGFFGGSPAYVGIATLALIALALVLGKPRAVVFFWAGAGLASLLLAFGNNLFAYPAFYLFAPGFDAVRQQERAFLIYSFSAAMLAGYGAVVLTGPLPKPARYTCYRFERGLRVAAAIALVMTGFYIYGSAASTARGDEVNLFFGVLRHHIFGLVFLGGMLLLLALRPRRWLNRWWGMSLIAIWIAFNLFTVNWRFNLEKRAEPSPFVPNGATQFLQSNLQPITNTPPIGRVASGGFLPGGNSAASVYNLEDLTGNTPLQLANVNTFLEQMPSWRLWQLLNVRYIVDHRDISDPGLHLVFAEDELKIFEMGDPFNRVWFVSTIEVVSGTQPAIARLTAADFDLRQTTIIAHPLNVSLEPVGDSTITVVERGPNHLNLATTASGRHLLVVSQTYYPGWQAKIDNQPAELLQVNAVQQGVLVPEGNHSVQLTFWPATFVVGLIVSSVTFFVCIVVVAVSVVVAWRGHNTRGTKNQRLRP